MLTTEQQEILRRVIDLNWEASHNEDEYVREQSQRELYEARAELINSMGVEAYMKFMATGRQMFS